MKNSVAVAVAVALVVVLVGGAIALYIMLRGGGDYEYTPPESYASVDCDVFLRFDTTANLGEVYDEVKPLLGLFKDEIDDEFQGFLDIDYDFLDIAGFFTTDDDENLVFGIKLSGKGNPKREIGRIVDMINEISGESFSQKDDYYMSSDVILYLDKGYVLIAEDKDAIEYVLAVKDGEIPSITSLDNWDKIDSVMESPYLSFYAQPPLEKDKRVQIAGSIYIDEINEEAGFAVAAIEGRDQLKMFEPDDEEFAGIIDTIFDTAQDLSPILSMTPDSSVRGALSFIPDFAGIETEENFAIDGLLGLWIDMIDFESDIDEFIGAVLLPENMPAVELMRNLFTEDEFDLVESDDGYLVYDKVNVDDDFFAPGMAAPSVRAFAKPDGDYLFVGSNTRIIGEWEPSKFELDEPSVLFASIDYGMFLESVIESDIPNPALGMFPADMFVEMMRQANIKLNFRVFERDEMVWLKMSVTGDFEKLESYDIFDQLDF